MNFYNKFSIITTKSAVASQINALAPSLLRQYFLKKRGTDNLSKNGQDLRSRTEGKLILNSCARHV